MSRFEPVTHDVVELVDNIQLLFPNLDGANIGLVFDTKKSVKSGKITVARIKKTNDEIKYFAMNDDGTAPDYVIFFDKNVWMMLSENDKRRVIKHELYHCEVNHEKKNPYSLRDHEIQTFYEEIEDNKDDPRWAERIGDIADSVYDKENE